VKKSEIFKIPLFVSPFTKGGYRGISICFILSAKKFIEKLMRVKENIKIDKSLCIDLVDFF
jgi:hypothetical protein